MKNPTTKLERKVYRWLISDGKKEAWSKYSDLMYGGCQSGIVGELIYYCDTVKFYNTHRAEIDNMLKDTCQDTGCSPDQLFGDKWDADDPLARDTYNKNLLAWFGFEETARRLMED